MNKTIYYTQRQEGYRKVLEEIKTNEAKCNDCENVMKQRIYEWWAN